MNLPVALHDRAAGLLRRLPAETAHDLALMALRRGWGPHIAADRFPRLALSVAGLDFPNPVGLAAGFDKNAVAVAGSLGLGVGFVEVGGVTLRPQAGNPKPRLFRLPRDGALINRMGFNNAGLATVRGRLAALPDRTGPVGVNLALNSDSTAPVAEFAALAAGLAPVADYLTADISCPNTANGHLFMDPGRLTELLAALNGVRYSQPIPLFVKLSPDTEAPAALERLVQPLLLAEVDGLIVGNSTRVRPSGLRDRARREAGGLSGAPLAPRALALLRRTRAATGGAIPLIAAGGIASAADAYARIRAGASLVQLYTALVYRGPGLVRRMLQELDALVAADGLPDIRAATGLDAPAAAPA